MAIFQVDVTAIIRREVEAPGHEEALKKAFREVEKVDEVLETISAHSEFMRGR